MAARGVNNFDIDYAYLCRKITMEKTEKNKALEVADIMAQVMEPQQSEDHEILSIVAQYSLQLRSDQQMVLTKLLILAQNPDVPIEQKKIIQSFVDNYQSFKRYHDTLPYIGKTVEALSLRRFWSNTSMQGIVSQQKH